MSLIIVTIIIVPSLVQSDLLSKCNPAVEHSVGTHLTAISRQFQDPSQQFPFHLSTGLRRFLSSALHCFYRRSLFIVCCTAFSIHICLFFTRGAILLGFKTAPLSEDDEDDVRYTNRPLRHQRKYAKRLTSLRRRFLGLQQQNTGWVRVITECDPSEE